MTLLAPHTRQIRRLKFQRSYWVDILTFSELNPGPLPLLRSLEIYLIGQPNTSPIPSSPLFSGAVNLEEFVFSLGRVGLLDHFVFPNLTAFKITTPPTQALNALDLLNFLEASPMLRTVEMEINGKPTSDSIPQGTLVILPNVETFSLFGKVYGSNVYQLATHISCPRTKNTSLAQEMDDHEITEDPEVFPHPALWDTIVRQYSTGSVKEVVFEMGDGGPAACSLTFKSPDGSIISLGLKVHMEEEDLDSTWGEVDSLLIVSQAFSTIRSHPLLSHLKHLYLRDWTMNLGCDCVLPMVKAVGDLFRRLGPLDVLTINGWDATVFLAPFIDLPQFRHFERVFPHVEQLTILHGRMDDYPRCMDAIVELAKSQYEKGKPFKRVIVTVGSMEIPAGMKESI